MAGMLYVLDAKVIPHFSIGVAGFHYGRIFNAYDLQAHFAKEFEEL